MCRYGMWEGWFSVCCSVSCPYNRDLCLQRHLHTRLAFVEICLHKFMLICYSRDGPLTAGGFPQLRVSASAKLNCKVELICIRLYFAVLFSVLHYNIAGVSREAKSTQSRVTVTDRFFQ